MITPDMTFGQRLKEFRKDRKLTQAELAKLSNLSRTNVANYEQEIVEPRFRNVVAIADALEVDVEYLIPEDWHINWPIKKEN